MEQRQPRISLDLLRGFEAAARHLNFTEAAAELFLTPSAVSRQIKTLEEQVARKLFVRSGRRLALTEAGLSLHQAVAQSQDVLGAALDRLRPQPRGASLVVAVAEPFATLVLAPALGAAQLPSGVRELKILSANDPDEHARVRPHVVIRHFRPRAAPVDALELAPDLVAPVCAPSLLAAARGGLRDPADLAHQVLLRYEAVIERRVHVDWVRWLTAHRIDGLRPRAWMHFNRYDQLVSAAVAGAGVMLGRLPLLRRLIDAGLLTEPWRDAALPTGSWCAVIDPRARERDAAERFVAALRGLMPGAPPPAAGPARLR